MIDVDPINSIIAEKNSQIAALTAEIERLKQDEVESVAAIEHLEMLYSHATKQQTQLEAEIERLKTALSGRTYFHSDAQVEAELAQLEATCAALEEMYSELYTHHIAEKHEGELAETEQLQADCRVMASAVLRAHNLVTHNSRHMPCTCDACGVARRYCEQHV